MRQQAGVQSKFLERLQKVRFVLSACEPKDYPRLMSSAGKPLPEVAIVGRSNVGKSSFINSLLGKKGLCRTSQTPGKTQLINFFTIEDLFAIVDLPGYGYAKVPKEMKETWGILLQHYLENRPQLHLIFLLIDMRRGLNAADLQFLKWAAFHNKKMVVVYTKVDKKLKSDSTVVPNDIEAVYYSSKTHEGRDSILKLLQEEFHGTH